MKLAAFTDVSDAARLALHVALGPWLPWRAEQRLARGITAFGMTRVGDLHARVTANLTAAFPATRTPAEIARLARANIQERWTERELVWLWRLGWSARRRRQLTEPVAIDGLDHLRAGLAGGRGVMLLEAHLGKRVLAREALRQAGFAVCQVHNHTHGGMPTRFGQHGLRRLHRFLARRAGLAIVEIVPGSLAYLRALTTRLRRNEIVVIPGLGTIGDKLVAVDALGTTLAVPTGTASLARATGAAVLPFFAFTDAAGRDHAVIEAPLPPPAAGDAGLVAFATAYVAVLDRWVRHHPAQWLWWFAPPTATAAAATARRLGAAQDGRR